MIKTVEVRDIFTAPAQTLVCPVNMVGTMGKGLAKAFKLRYPGLDQAYQIACKNHVFDYQGLSMVGVGNGQYTLLFATKYHWRRPSPLELIESGLTRLAQRYEELGITSLAMPMIGCGEGGLRWEYVYPLIMQHLDPLPIPVHICLSPEKNQKKK
jgi:O-acetyl-ADP-ribose deacetylase (regulator of RNase III)